MNFSHLHVHTVYSLLDGAIKIPDLIAKAKELEMPAVAITDHGSLFGILDFYLQAQKAGIKPIIGCEVYVAPESIDKKEKNEDVQAGYHLILLAKNNNGLQNLIKLCSIASLEGFYYKPRVDKKLLAQHSNGLIALSGCMQGEVAQKVLKGDMDNAISKINEYQNIFSDNFYLEVQANEIAEQDKINKSFIELSSRTGVPLVATNDCHYLNAEDQEAHDVLLCVQTNSKYNDDKRMSSKGKLHVKSEQEMLETLGDEFSIAMENVSSIVESCNVSFDLDNYRFPKYVPEHASSLEEEFEILSREGLKDRLSKLDYVKEEDEYWDRLEYEISTIKDMGFPGYFLIVQDFINWAKKRGIAVGPGRGSAAGSLVAYSLGITDLDPIPYNLLFERFLNKERVSMPDIDVDFCEKNREKVIRYVVEKYGEDHVAQITTFGSLKTKGAIRDVGRALGLSYKDTDMITKQIGDDIKSINDIYADSELNKLTEMSKEHEKTFYIANKLEGIARHASTHAAGIVIGDQPLHECMPLYRGKNKEIVSQFDMNMVEKAGFIKFDFLGLRTMTVIDETCKMVRKTVSKDFYIENVSLQDPKVYGLYARGETDGIFQVESSGMQSYLRQLQPSCFEDIIAMLALYRPGPLGSGMVEEYMKRKNGEVEIDYIFPELEEILKPTYGIIVYQEQVMQIAQKVSGYTLGQADILRKAMGKKKAEVMQEQKTKFIQGGIENGYEEEKVAALFEMIEKFAAYGFNKSHSAAYALISYYTAYLKTHYPLQFMAALLSSEMNDHDKILKYVGICREWGLKILPPDINQSLRNFSVEEESIRCGLGVIKAVGDKSIDMIISERSKNGPYKNIFDLVNRVKTTKKTMQALIVCGAFDSFKISRKAMEENIENILCGKKKEKKKIPGQKSLLSLIPESRNVSSNNFAIEDNGEWEDYELLSKEKDVLGFFLSFHPLEKYLKDIQSINTLTTITELLENQNNRYFDIPALVVSKKEKKDKRDNTMAFLEIEDNKKSTKGIAFGSSYAKFKHPVEINELYVFRCKPNSDEQSLIIDNMFPLQAYIEAAKSDKKDYITDSNDNFSNILEETENVYENTASDNNNNVLNTFAPNDDNLSKNKEDSNSEAAKVDCDSKKEEDKSNVNEHNCSEGKNVNLRIENNNCILSINDSFFSDKNIKKLKEIIYKYEGEAETCIEIIMPDHPECERVLIALGNQFNVDICPEFQEEVNSLFNPAM